MGFGSASKVTIDLRMSRSLMRCSWSWWAGGAVVPGVSGVSAGQLFAGHLRRTGWSWWANRPIVPVSAGQGWWSWWARILTTDFILTNPGQDGLVTMGRGWPDSAPIMCALAEVVVEFGAECLPTGFSESPAA